MIREKIVKSINMYLDGQYNTETFCDIFMENYFYEESGYRFFGTNEKKMLDELANTVERFSPFVDDVAEYEKFYISEQCIKEKAEKVAKLLNF